MKIAGALICVLLALVAVPLRAQDGDVFALPHRPSGPFEIRGILVDSATGQPVAEVEVTIEDGAQPPSPTFETVETAANGAFRFANLAEGKYTIRAARQGYVPQAYLQHENFWTGIAVGPGKDATHLLFPLSPSATVTGQVIDENGEFVRGANVMLWSARLYDGKQGITRSGAATADDEGRYRFEHLLAGNYSVSVTAMPWYSRYSLTTLAARQAAVAGGVPGGAWGGAAFVPVGREGWTPPAEDSEPQNPVLDVVYPTIYFPNSRDWQGMEWFKLQAGQVENADFHLAPEPSFHLQVQLAKSRDTGRMGAVNLLEEIPGGTRAGIPHTNTNSGTGALEISGVPAGHYYLQEGWGDAESLEEIDVQGSAQVGLPPSRLSGPALRVVIYAESENMGNFAVQLRSTVGQAYQGTFTWVPDSDPNANGLRKPGFQFESLPTGPQTYEFVLLQPAAAVVRRIEAKGAKVAGTKIETDGAQEATIEVTVVPAVSTIEGIAVKDGKPFAGAMILLMPEGGKDWERLSRRDQSDSDGTFRLANVAPGKYALFALENGWNLEWSKPENLKPFAVKAQILDIGESQVKSETVEVQ